MQRWYFYHILKHNNKLNGSIINDEYEPPTNREKAQQSFAELDREKKLLQVQNLREDLKIKRLISFEKMTQLRIPAAIAISGEIGPYNFPNEYYGQKKVLEKTISEEEEPISP